MKKLMLSLATILALSGTAKATVLAQYTFTGSSFASSDTDLNTTAANMTSTWATPSGISTTVGNPAGSYDIYKNQMSGSLNTGNYLEFTVTRVGANVMNLTSLTFETSAQSVNTGNWVIRSSIDGFAANLASGTIVAGNGFQMNTVNLSAANFQNLTTVTFRLYAYNDKNIDLYYDNIVLNGTTAVPEPVNVALVLFGCTFAGVGVGRKFLKKKAA